MDPRRRSGFPPRPALPVRFFPAPPRVRRLVLPALLLGLCVYPRLGTAQTATPARPVDFIQNLSLEELMKVRIVTATQVESDPFSLPFMTQAYSRRDLGRQHPRTLPHWLSEVPGVMVQKTANGQQSPYLRGLTGFRTLFLIDGIRLNNSVFRDGPNQYWGTVDALSVAQLEIVKGPGAVLYGSDSIGGTVNALTIGPRDYRSGDEASRAWHGFSGFRYSTAEDSHIARAEIAGALTDRTGALLGGSFKSFGDYRAGPALGRRPHTGYQERAYDAKLEHRFAPNVVLNLAYQALTQDDVWRTHSTPFGDTWLGLRPGTDRRRTVDQARQLTYTQLHATDLKGFVQEAHVSLSYQTQDEDQDRIRRDGRRELADLGVITLGATAQLHSATPVGRLVYGATYYHDHVDSANDRYLANGTFERSDPQGAVGDDSHYDLAGLYVQNQLPSWGPFTFSVRGRYDRAQARVGRMLDPLSNSVISLRRSWDSLVGSGRLSWQNGEHWLAFANIAQGFRAPNLSDLSRLDIAATGQIETPSASVSPERYVIHEVGLKYRKAGVGLEAALFRTQIQGMIIRVPSGRTFNGLAEVTKNNSGDGFIQGAEFQGHLQIGSAWVAQAAYTWMEGELTVFPTSSPNLQVREPISRLMPPTTRLALRYEPLNRPYSAELIHTLVGHQHNLSASDRLDTERIPPGGTPGYRVWTLRAAWKFPRNFTLSAALENLTDRDYRIHGSGINEPGRNLILSGTFKF